MPGAAPGEIDTTRVARAVTALRERAYATNPTLLAARARLAAARARAGAFGFSAPAYLSGGVSEAPGGDIDRGNLRLEIGRELLTGQRRRAERGLAEVDARRASATLAATGRALDAAVLREVVRAAGARLVVARLASEDALLTDAEEGLRTRFAVGDARYVDVLRLRTERLRVQSARASALAELRAGRVTLSSLVGDDDAGRRTLGLVLDTLVTVAEADAWRSLLPEPPPVDSLLPFVGELQLATLAIDRAMAEGAIAAASRRPQLEAFAGVQRIGQSDDGPTFGPSAGFTLSLPFTASRATRRGVEATTSAIRAAHAARVATTGVVRARLAAVTERYQAARERLAVFDAALLRGAREERESALAAYRGGSLSLLELLDFERALSRAEIDRVAALVEAADAYADLVSGADADEHDPGLTILDPTASEGR